MTLSLEEATNCVIHLRIDCIDTPEEYEAIFKLFDRDGSGQISYDEFLRAIRGEMNAFRKGLCMKAFRILDVDNSGTITMNEIKSKYSAKMHPDVKAGKKTEDEVIFEFIDTFDQHYRIMHSEDADHIVTADEWIEYYNNVSMSIDDDKYFELMMDKAWDFSGSRVTKKGTAMQF